ncbi:hypothetical protein F4Y93_13215, partial [Candidatus Poribacteria bacterium]|nr:hypothetical protein [Candidatus Poribacteria bacterium]
MEIHIRHYNNIPNCWEPVLERLKRFEALAQQINKAKKEQQSDLSETLKRFYTQHNALLADTRSHLQHVPSDCDEATLDIAFVEAVWLALEHYPALVHHREIENLDTAGSKIFTLFTPDAPASLALREKLKNALQRAFNLNSETVDRLNQDLSLRARPLNHRHQILKSLETRFNLVSDNPKLDAD